MFSAQVTDENSTESVEGVSQPGASAEVKNPELAPGPSPTTTEEKTEENTAAETETDSSSLTAFTEDPNKTVHGPESEGEEEEDPEAEQEAKEDEDGTEPDKQSEKRAEVNKDSTPHHKEEVKQTKVEEEEEEGGKKEEKSSSLKPTVSTENDLDEMMDIGTVDQMEQEAQMKEGQQSDRSPSELQTGKTINFYKKF